MRAWRATRRRGQRIPEELWKAATDLGHVHGLGPTASALNLNFYDLQSRLQAGCGQGKGFDSQPTFVELPAPAFMTPLTDPGTLELVGSSGSRLTLRWPHCKPKELLPLVHAFLRHRA